MTDRTLPSSTPLSTSLYTPPLVPVRPPLRSVYLSGPISGLRYADAIAWREQATRALAPDLLCYSPLRYHEHLAQEGVIRGVYDSHPLTTSAALTARDCLDCYACDLTLCNLLGATEVSIGTCIELGWTASFSRPVVLVMEAQGNVHDHPLVRVSCAFRVDTLEEGLRLVRAILLP